MSALRKQPLGFLFKEVLSLAWSLSNDSTGWPANNWLISVLPCHMVNVTDSQITWKTSMPMGVILITLIEVEKPPTVGGAIPWLRP